MPIFPRLGSNMASRHATFWRLTWNGTSCNTKKEPQSQHREERRAGGGQGGSHIKVTRVTSQKVHKSRLVGVAWIHFNPWEVPILKQNCSSYIFFPPLPIALKGTGITLTVIILDFERRILTPKRYHDYPRHFHMELWSSVVSREIKRTGRLVYNETIVPRRRES